MPSQFPLRRKVDAQNNHRGAITYTCPFNDHFIIHFFQFCNSWQIISPLFKDYCAANTERKSTAVNLLKQWRYMLGDQKVCYISGPMQNTNATKNYEHFNEVSNWLRFLGFQVLNPAENQPAPRSDLFRKDIKHVANSDRIVLLDGWEFSPGACLELADAREIGAEVWLFTRRSLSESKALLEGPYGRIVHKSRATKTPHVRRDKDIAISNGTYKRKA